jgi:hypothetical protein
MRFIGYLSWIGFGELGHSSYTLRPQSASGAVRDVEVRTGFDAARRL